jgi:hypothetical protein
MVGLLLTVGVSVDFTTHITYHYYKEQLPADATTEESIDRLRYVDPLASVKHTHTHPQTTVHRGWLGDRPGHCVHNVGHNAANRCRRAHSPHHVDCTVHRRRARTVHE